MLVHIGTRIFRFFDNGGLVIVLNNDWTAYNNIKNAEFSSILSSESIVVTNQDYSSWGDLYYFDANDNISSEMPVTSIIENPTYPPV